MEENNSIKSNLEEQMLRAMSMSIYGKHVESRCRVLSPGQRAELEAAARQNNTGPMQADMENAASMGQ